MLKILLVLFLASPSLMAEDVKLGLSNESALGYVVTGGNSKSETTSITHKSEYNWERDVLTFTGHYLQASGEVETSPTARQNKQTAENWSATVRFEKIITPKTFNAFLAHGWRGDLFQGIRQAHSTDVGAKYFWMNSTSLKFFSTLGYRYTRELLKAAAKSGVGVGDRISPEYHYLLATSQVDYAYSKSFAVGLMVEYTPSVTDFAEDQRVNFSPYLTSVLTDMFSLKVAYAGNYRSLPAVTGNEYLDFTFTTSLLAKF